MEKGSIIGFILCAVLMFGGMIVTSGSLMTYWDLTSILITLGGSIGATVLASPWSRSTQLPKLFSIVFKQPVNEIGAIIDILLTFGEKARKEGVLSLEDDVSEIPDPFLQKAIRLVVDGTDPEVVKRIMYNEINKLDGRHKGLAQLFVDWGAYAPAFGMIGTLVGLIALLGNLADTAALGRGMSIALITTLYGSITANWICIPMAAKLQSYNEDEVLIKEIILEGVLSIQAGDNPAILRERLNSFLGSSSRRKESED
ncbi:MAG: motility protein A [Brevinema sp.]